MTGETDVQGATTILNMSRTIAILKDERNNARDRCVALTESLKGSERSHDQAEKRGVALRCRIGELDREREMAQSALDEMKGLYATQMVRLDEGQQTINGLLTQVARQRDTIEHLESELDAQDEEEEPIVFKQDAHHALLQTAGDRLLEIQAETIKALEFQNELIRRDNEGLRAEPGPQGQGDALHLADVEVHKLRAHVAKLKEEYEAKCLQLKRSQEWLEASHAVRQAIQQRLDAVTIELKKQQDCSADLERKVCDQDAGLQALRTSHASQMLVLKAAQQKVYDQAWEIDDLKRALKGLEPGLRNGALRPRPKAEVDPGGE